MKTSKNTSKGIIGIDLGTTNSTVAFVASIPQNKGEKPLIEQFNIPQVSNAQSEAEMPMLPSFVYLPLQEELDKKIGSLSWAPDRTFSVGTFARDRGAEVPSRLISSWKSWLCHAGIDRRSQLLPLGDDDLQRMSPLEACSEVLRHLRESWNIKHQEMPFNQQQIFITVPASFDPSARQLVQEAAELAGYPEVILLEEPQAAFYAWLHLHGEHWRKHLVVGDTILVIDVGGGTTDFSLIEVNDQDGSLSLNRLAVGSHLLLGGDNIDLALAYYTKNKLEEAGHTIDDWQLQALTHACRSAKEKLLGPNPPKEMTVTIQGRGRKLVGGSLSTTLTLQEVENLLIEGFIPIVNPEDQSPVEKRSGIQQIGLPYTQDPRISCQIARFLAMNGEGTTASMDKFILPTAVLFNGGTMKSEALRQQIVNLLNAWAKQLNKPSIKVLPDPNYDFAVSQGAAFYGVARAGQAIRIKGGTSRSYYIGVEDAMPAIPGLPAPLKAVCVVPYGMEEGTEEVLRQQEFALLLGEQATFRFFSRSTPKLSNDIEPLMGTVVKNWKQELTELHPIETLLEKQEGDGKTVRISLQSRVTEVGVLELWCVAQDGRKWKLEFDLRHQNVPQESIT